MKSLTLSRAAAFPSAGIRPWAAIRPVFGLAALLGLFAAAALVVPTLTPVATTDDWGYTRSVEFLLQDGHLTVFPVVAATAVFQIGWGALFGAVFGMSLGIVRVSTLVMTGLGAAAVYGLLGELGVTANRRLLGVATYLFNPLAFILSYTFMTDVHFAALMTGAIWFYARGVRLASARWLAAGSAVAACAFLTRQQGALIPLALGLFLLASGQLRVNRRSICLLLAVGAIPAAAIAGYYLWLLTVNDVPDVQQGFAKEATAAGVDGAARLATNLTFIEAVYFGFFLLPLALALIPALRALAGQTNKRGWLAFVTTLTLLDIGFSLYGVQGKWMPYIGQFAGTGGLGPPDVLGSRARLLHLQDRIAITVVCGFALCVVAFALCRAFARGDGALRGAPGAVAAIALFQIAGVLPPSFHYLHRGYSLDRYLLPLFPLGIALALWSARDLRLWLPLGWVAIAFLAVVSVVGTRDYLTYMATVWRVAENANGLGITNEHLDAGAAWDGYHLYTLGLDQGITRARSRSGPWWVFFYGKATDSLVVVSGQPITGYSIIAKQTYDPWWGPKDTIYLLGKPGFRVSF